WAPAALPRGAPAGPPAASTHGINFTLHMLRHSRATDLLRHGVPVDVVAWLLTHRSSVEGGHRVVPSGASTNRLEDHDHGQPEDDTSGPAQQDRAGRRRRVLA